MIPPILDFLVFCINNTSTASSAICALQELCQSCPLYLVQGTESLIALWGQYNSVLVSQDNARLIRSITALLTHMETPKAHHHFMGMVEHIVESMISKLNATHLV